MNLSILRTDAIFPFLFVPNVRNDILMRFLREILIENERIII